MGFDKLSSKSVVCCCLYVAFCVYVSWIVSGNWQAGNDETSFTTV